MAEADKNGFDRPLNCTREKASSVAKAASATNTCSSAHLCLSSQTNFLHGFVRSVIATCDKPALPRARNSPAMKRKLSAPCTTYLAGSLLRTSDVDTRRRLRHSTSSAFCWHSHAGGTVTRRSTLGDRTFPVASARVWNSLPSSVSNAPSLTTFRRELKTVLFRSSFDND